MQSHPMWVRGLKLPLNYPVGRPHGVAPYVGAWIETSSVGPSVHVSSVAPYVGAWIETVTSSMGATCSAVAPYVGAWIETL